MDKLEWRLYTVILIVGVFFGAWITKSYMDKHTDVAQVITKDHVVTKIIERKDGSKETVIVSDHAEKSTSKTAKVDNWSVGVGQSLGNRDKSTVYTAYIDRRILGPLSLGAYANTEQTYGVFLRYSF